MYSTDAETHALQDLIHAIQNPAHARPILKLGNEHKEALRYLGEIFGKSPPPEISPRVPVRGAYQLKN